MRTILLPALALVLAAAGTTAAVTAQPARAAACTITSPDNSNCGPYDDPAAFTPSNGFNTYVGTDVFNPEPGESWTLTADSPSAWDARFTLPAGDTAVSAYPSTGQQFPDPANTQQGTPLSEFSSLTSDFAENMNANSGTDAEAAYDLWFDNSGASNELMIQFDFSALRPRCGNPASPTLAVVPFTEPGTGTVQQWDFCPYGNELIWGLHSGSEQSGSVDLLAMMLWPQQHGYLASGSRFSLLGFGTEVCSTGGQPEDFQVTRLDAIATYNGGPSPSPSPTSTSPSPSPTPTSPSPSPSTTSPGPSPSTSTPPPGTVLLGDTATAPALDSNPQGTAQAYPYTAAQSGMSATVSFYVDPSSTATAGDIGIYADDGWGNPGRLLGQAAFTPQAGWDTVTLAGVPVTAGTTYWLAELGTSAGTLAYRDGGPAGAHGYSETSGTGLTALPATWGSGFRWDGGVASAYVSG